MSWTSQLYRTYERNQDPSLQKKDAPAPVAHMYATAQLEVILNAEGNFLSAKRLEKEEGRTLIPVTESSAARGSGIAPHGLCDMLPYVAGDFEDYCKPGKGKKTAHDKFTTFIEHLAAWTQSEYNHPKAEAVYRYLMKKEMISDLIQSGLVGLEKESKTFDTQKISGQPYEKALVRFRIYGAGDLVHDGTWEDSTLIETYTKYYLSSNNGKTDVCYMTGRQEMISYNHPKGIVRSDYMAKLISTNDNQGYTYRGRFQGEEQAYALSYEASQKIHSALTWLMLRQGTFVGSQDKRSFVCWCPEGKKTPDILDEFALLNDEEVEEVPDDQEDTGYYYRRKLSRLFQGYREQFNETDQIIVMGLDAATTGRLSITYYNEFGALDFLNKMESWGLTCRWEFPVKIPEKKSFRMVESPIFRRIAECAFGRQRGTYIDLDDRILKEQTQRLVKCMLEEQPVPTDIVVALADRASTPMAYSFWNREIVLSTACAVIWKYHCCEYEEEREQEMKLNLENQDRSYLFGRLLAVLEKAERLTYDWGETREPNAIRLQSAFVNHPMQTWKVLEDTVRPYFQKLSPGKREEYRGLISKILGMMREEDAPYLNQKLKETYLLGYYLQRAELDPKKDEEE